MIENGVKTEIHYPVHPHMQKAMKLMNSLKFPVSEEIHRTTLSLPISTFHSENDIKQVVRVLNDFSILNRNRD
jgi:dTDP-4-amino-4,6-dideoxygalactose transaminase